MRHSEIRSDELATGYLQLHAALLRPCLSACDAPLFALAIACGVPYWLIDQSIQLNTVVPAFFLDKRPPFIHQ